MKRAQRLLAILLAGLLIACLIAAYLTRDARPGISTARQRTGPNNSIDQRLFQTAQQLAALADSREERSFARDVVRLSDHELDQGFASALREAATASVPKTGPLREIADRIEEWNQKVAGDQVHVAKLTAEGSSAPAGQLDLAKAQLDLDQDELEDARQELIRAGGDPRARIQRAVQQHDAVEHQTTPAQTTFTSAAMVTLYDQVRGWSALRDRQRQVEAAEEQATAHIAALDKQHDAIEALAKSQEGTNDTSVAALQQLGDERKSLADLDKRIQDTQQLSDTYRQWGAAIDARRTSVTHLLLKSFAMVLGILLAAVLIDFLLRRTFKRRGDPRQFHRIQVMTTVALQVVAALLIALVIFGPPNQISTVIGLATAGLTVALRDFILAFLGWFTLMGRNGIRIGDWVEIQGVGGEVVEIGLMRTVLLEVGDSDTGQPTGRRVSFVNSFAIAGHYFNFSTAGQWLWDELQVSLPVTTDPYQLAYKIRDVVERETLSDVSEAEKDWERVTRKYGTRPFSAKPVADLRPSGSGFNVIMRYITHAPKRNEVKSRIFKAVVELLHKPVESAAGATPAS